MPYIDPKLRDHLHPEDRRMIPMDATSPGELNFQVTKLIDDYMVRYGLNYGTVNEVIGVLECAKLEMYARVARPYENSKIRSNGDVYSPYLVNGYE